MTIGFLVLRDTFLKTMGSLILASAKRGHRVLLFYLNDEIRGDKAYQRVTAEKLSIFGGKEIEALPIRLEELGSLEKENEVDVLVVLEGFHVLNAHPDAVGKLRRSGVIVVSLPHFFETARGPLKSLDHFDRTYYLSEFALNLHFTVNWNAKSIAELRKKHGRQYEVTGSPMFDQIPNVDPEKYRSEFGIPSGKKVIVLFAPVISAVTPWRFYIWRVKEKRNRVLRILKDRKWQYLAEALSTPSFEEIVSGIREYCDENNAFLIVKSRQKQEQLDYLVNAADLYLGGAEEEYFPVFTSFKLLSMADLCITSMSMAVAESIAVGTPVVNIIVPHMDLNEQYDPSYSDKEAYLDAVMNPEREGPFNFPGCVTAVDRRKVIQWMKENKLDDISWDETAAEKYRQKYLGITDKLSSERILNSIETIFSEKMRETRSVA